MTMLTRLKSFLSPQDAPGERLERSRHIREGYELERPEGVEDWSSITKAHAEMTGLTPEACLRIQDALDEAGVELERVDAVWESLRTK